MIDQKKKIDGIGLMKQEFECGWVVYHRNKKKFYNAGNWSEKPVEFFTKTYADKLANEMKNCVACEMKSVVEMPLMDINTELFEILGNTYGGPSISIEGGKLVLYRWYDAPAGMDIIAKGDTLEELVKNFKNNKVED